MDILVSIPGPLNTLSASSVAWVIRNAACLPFFYNTERKEFCTGLGNNNCVGIRKITENSVETHTNMGVEISTLTRTRQNPVELMLALLPTDAACPP
jgi:hypothetical protein